MRKIFYLSILLILVIFFVGCQYTSDTPSGKTAYNEIPSTEAVTTTENQETTIDTTDSEYTTVENVTDSIDTSDSTEESTDPTEQTTEHTEQSTQTSTGNGETITYTFDSRKEYDDFINTISLPDNFIHCDKLKQFGEFKSIVFLTDIYSGDFSQYLYSFVDETGYRVSLYIRSNPEDYHFHSDKDKYTCIDSVGSTDMRYIKEYTKGTYLYYYEDLKYTYVSGQLISIEWIYEEIEYTLLLHGFPEESSMFISMLLNYDEAIKAFNEFYG